MQTPLGSAESLHRHDMTAIELIEKQDAGIDGHVAHTVASRPTDENGAGAAIPLGADDLGAGEPKIAAEEIGERGEGRVAPDFQPLAVHV